MKLKPILLAAWAFLKLVMKPEPSKEQKLKDSTLKEIYIYGKKHKAILNQQKEALKDMDVDKHRYFVELLRRNEYKQDCIKAAFAETLLNIRGYNNTND